MRGDEDVAREEGFEVYEGECEGGCVEDLPLCLSLGVCFGGFGGWCCWYEWESYLGGYGEGPEFDEFGCEGCHFSRLGSFYCLLDRVYSIVLLMRC